MFPAEEGKKQSRVAWGRLGTFKAKLETSSQPLSVALAPQPKLQDLQVRKLQEASGKNHHGAEGGKMTLGLAAGVEHHEKQQPEKSTSCLQATVPLMRMKGLGKGRVAGSHPAQHGGWHEGDIHMCSARTKPLQWLESQFPQMGAHCVTTVFPPSFDPFKLNGKTTPCCTQVDPLGSALTPGPREATRWGRAQRVAAPGATSPKRRCSGSACSPSPRRQMSGTFASQFI